MENIQTHEEVNEDTVESADHVQEMLQKAEELEQLNSTEERPEWLPEKFASVEQMAEAYKQLEQKLGSQGQEEEEYEEQYEEVDEEVDDVDVNADASQVEQVITDAGLDFNAMQSEYAQNGGLSDETYEALNESGFPPELVDSWIQGQEALVNNFQETVFEQVGGQENYQQMLAWAADNLSDGEIAAYDNAIDSGDLGTVQLALSGLQTKFQSETGTDPSLIDGQSTTVAGGAYGSWAEATADIGNPKYETDPAFREQVAAKLMRSNLN